MEIDEMPLYEYRCRRCQRRVTLLASFGQPTPPCPACGDASLQRLLSTFSVGKTGGQVYEDILGDSQLTSGLKHNDPRALAEWNRRMSGGEKVAPEYEDMLGRMEKGEMPAGPVD
ncbi:MAG: zinc ribbon domain-containing protein [Chloroflexota bacterium]